ncbi:MAG: hypothetical protein WCG01_02430 [bacterium]
MEQEKCNKCNTIKKGKIELRIIKNKEKILDELEKNMGIVRNACKKVGISPKTYYLWLQEDEEFAKKVDVVEWAQRYYVEGKLLGKIANDDTASIIFYLKCRHPNYKVKSEIDTGNSADMEQMRKDFSDLINQLKQDNNAKPPIANHTD